MLAAEGAADLMRAAPFFLFIPQRSQSLQEFEADWLRLQEHFPPD
jgi:hypothetical protein